MEKIIEINNLVKNYGKKKVLKNINLTINKGEKIALMGANGAGKTTIIEILLKIIKPTEGETKINLPSEQVGVQYQDANFPNGITTLDVIKFFNEVKQFDINQKELEKQLEFFDMKDYMNQDTRGLSGGQNQKINLILAVVHKPKLIILDEITTGLDIATKEKILDYLEKVIADPDVTLLIISHNVDEVLRLTDRLIYLKDGRVVMDQAIKKVKNLRQITDLEKQIMKFI